jgi:hypothetical protein
MLNERNLSTNSNFFGLELSTSNYRLMDKTEVKLLFGLLMGTLCLITTIGNICVIYRYRKASMVNIPFSLYFKILWH